MIKIIHYDNDSYIFLPSKTKVAYVSFPASHTLFKDKDMPFKLDEIASRDISINKYDWATVYKGEQNAEGVYWFRPAFYRGVVEPTEVGRNTREGLEDYLNPTETLDSDHELVVETAHEIQKMVGTKERDNAYLLGEATAVWIRSNIKYTVVPPRLINRVASTIKGLEDRTDAYKILRYSFNIKEDVLKRVASNCHLQGGMGDRETAKDLMTQVNNVWKFFQLSWKIEETKASKTLEERSGKCVGIANTYVALLRAMGVPSRTAHGYAGDKYGILGGMHAWATLHIPGFGWKEADPTWGEYANFSFDKHAYYFFSEENTSPAFWFIGEGESNFLVDEAIKLVETKRKNGIKNAKRKLHFWDNLFKTSKSKRMTELEDELMTDELAYLKRFQ